MLTLYGIPNCDTVRKARKWLEAHGVAFAFRDLRKEGVSEAELKAWVTRLGRDTLLNRRGRTWRELPAAQRDAISSDADAVALMQACPTVIKRPVLVDGSRCLCGFSETEYEKLLR